MARVALISELGVGHDHLRRLAWIARALQARGHEPVFIVNDPVKADGVLGDSGWRVLPAPLWRAPVAGLPPTRNYTDLLLRHGFVDAGGLRALMRSWRHLLDLVRPSLLLLDHAPMALHASRGRGLPRLRCGDGFGCPPLATPMPAFAWWAPADDPFDQIGERTAVHMANLVAAELGEAPVESVASLLSADAELLCTVPELDHYGSRGGPACVGAVVPPAEVSGPRLPWPDGDGALAYVQLRADYAHLDAVLSALRQRGWRVVLHAPGLPRSRAQALASDSVQVAPEMPPPAEVAAHCRVAIGHGGYGSVHALAAAGAPQLLLALQTSQAMLAHRVEQQGAGIAVDPQPGVPDVDALLQRLGDGAALAAGAAALAQRLRAGGGQLAVDAVVQRCEALL